MFIYYLYISTLSIGLVEYSLIRFNHFIKQHNFIVYNSNTFLQMPLLQLYVPVIDSLPQEVYLKFCEKLALGIAFSNFFLFITDFYL